MEFLLNSQYIELNVNNNFEDDKNYINILQGNKINLKEIIYQKNSDEEKKKTNLEIFVNLDDYYLINNINILINKNLDNSIRIFNVQFRSIKNDSWENAYFNNPDSNKIITRNEDSISLFSVGLTNKIKLNFEVINIEIPKDIKNFFENKINKIIIYSQYIHSIPNATFLMTLLNLKIFFENFCLKKENDDLIINHFCALYITSTSMIQARLFIQSWELLSKFQKFILNNKNENVNFFLEILFEINDENHNNIHVFLTKIELIKSLCMFEHGHTQIFLMCLKNCLEIFNNKNFSSVNNNNICFNKVNEIANDKYNIRKFLHENGKKLSEILMKFLKNKNEIIIFSILKIFEFMIDYNPHVLFENLGEIVKFLFETSFSNSKQKESTNFNQPIFFQKLKEKKLFCNQEIYISFINLNHNNKSTNKETKKQISSQVLQKQINYTIDTIISDVASFENDLILQILSKNNAFLFEILKNSEKNNLIYICALKLLKKCYENVSISYDFDKLFDLFSLCLKPNIKSQFKEYLNFQTENNVDFKSRKNRKDLKESLTNITNKNNVLNFLLNSNNLLDSNDFSCLIFIMLDKISNSFIFNHDGAFAHEIVNYVRTILDFLKNEAITNYIEKDFAIYYLYLILQFFIIVYFSNNKEQIQKEIFKLNKNKLLNKNVLHNLINSLFELIEFTLSNKKSYILFECALQILAKIKEIYDPENDDFSYENYLLKTYDSLAIFIETNGIFNENIKFFLKTLPLCEMNNREFIFNVKKCFDIFLKNFENYYNEEAFHLFSLFLEKLKKNFDKNSFKNITKTMINKSNYKGNIFKQCYNKYNNIIFENEEYLNFYKEIFNEGLSEYKNNMEKFNRDKFQFKNCYLKFLDQIELYKKYFEFLSENKNQNQNFFKNFLLFDNKSFDLIIDCLKYNDDTIISKFNSLIEENINLLNVYLKNENKKILDEIVNNLIKYFSISNQNENYFLLHENLLILNKFVNEIKNVSFIDNNSKQNYFSLFNKTIPNEIINKIKLKPIYNELFSFYINIILNLFDANEFNFEYKNEIENVILNHLKNPDETKEKNGLKLILKIFNFDFYEENFPFSEINVDFISNFKEKINILFKNEKNFWLLNLIKISSNFISNKNDYQIILFYYLIINVFIPEAKKLEFESEIKTFNENFSFLSNEETLNLMKVIKDDFQTEKNKLKLFETTDENIANNNNEVLEDEFQEKEIKVDEINDELDLEDFEDDDEDDILIETYNKNNENPENNNVLNMKDDDDNLTLEDLGVKEVDENIFDNFDEENIPVLKKNSVRCKGYAAKFKTNQNSRTLLMSEQIQQNNNNNIFNNNIFNNNNLINSNQFNSENNLPLNLNDIILQNKNQNEIIIENNNDNKKEEDFTDVPDLTQKKKNIRPLNGFRPATPPLRNTNSNNIPNEIPNNNVFVNNVNNNNNVVNNNDNNFVNKEIKKKNIKKKKKIRANSDDYLKNKIKKIDEKFYNKKLNEDFRNTIKKKLNQNQNKIASNFKKINSQRENNKFNNNSKK